MDLDMTVPGDDTARLRALITGYEAAQCVYAAAKLGVADALGDGPRSVSDLAGVVLSRTSIGRLRWTGPGVSLNAAIRAWDRDLTFDNRISD